jgi:ketosteroid isomerase-like protein
MKIMNQEITNLLKAYEKALNTSDTKAAMALYGSEPIFMAQNAVAFIGRDAVQASYQHIFEALKLNVVFSVHEIVEMGDLAYGRTTSAGQQEALAAHTTSKEANNELFIFRKESRRQGETVIELKRRRNRKCNLYYDQTLFTSHLGARDCSSCRFSFGYRSH